MSFADVELAVGTLVGVVGALVGVSGWRASKRAAKAEARVGLLDAVQAYEAALAPYRERYLSAGLATRPGDRELILEHLPALKAAKERLLVVLHRAEPDDFRFCRRLSELEIRRFNTANVSIVVSAAMAARAEAVSGESGLSLPDGENYEIVAVQRATLLT